MCGVATASSSLLLEGLWTGDESSVRLSQGEFGLAVGLRWEGWNWEQPASIGGLGCFLYSPMDQGELGHPSSPKRPKGA